MFSGGYNWNGVFPYSTKGSTECVTGHGGIATPLPYEPAIPTKIESPDPKDLLGWTYCYLDTYRSSLIVDTGPLFPGDLIQMLSNWSNCRQDAEGWAPAENVKQASFLLETTTAFVSGKPTTEESKSSPPKTTVKPPPNTALLPTRKTSTSDEKPTADPVDPAPSLTEKTRLPSKPEDETTRRGPPGQDSTPSTASSSNSQNTNNPGRLSTGNRLSNPKPEPTPNRPGAAPTTKRRLGTLISFIHEIGQQQSKTKQGRTMLRVQQRRALLLRDLRPLCRF